MATRTAMVTIMATLTLAACTGSASEAGSTTTSTVTMSTSTTSTTESTTPVVLEAFDAGGAGGTGQTVSPLDLLEGTAYQFDEFVPSFLAAPPSPNWAVGLHTAEAALFEWTGENGQRPGSLYVLVFDGSESSVDQAWERLEATITESMSGFGGSLEWIDRSFGTVGDITADWRELRTPAEVIRPGGWPCVISLPGGCVWTDATARFYVVPLGTKTVTIAVYENRCDCEVGDSYSKFARGANELHDWSQLFEELLRSLDFET